MKTFKLTKLQKENLNLYKKLYILRQGKSYYIAKENNKYYLMDTIIYNESQPYRNEEYIYKTDSSNKRRVEYIINYQKEINIK